MGPMDLDFSAQLRFRKWTVY